MSLYCIPYEYNFAFACAHYPGDDWRRQIPFSNVFCAFSNYLLHTYCTFYAPSTQGFVGHGGSQCASYAPGKPNHKHCFKDFHKGPDIAFKNQNACTACSECATNKVCKTTGFAAFGRTTTCEDYRYCILFVSFCLVSFGLLN